MRRTITVLLNNRFNDAERIIGMFSSTGYKIEGLSMNKPADAEFTRLVIVAEIGARNLENLLVRLRHQIRVSLVECIDGDDLNRHVENEDSVFNRR